MKHAAAARREIRLTRHFLARAISAAWLDRHLHLTRALVGRIVGQLCSEQGGF